MRRAIAVPAVALASVLALAGCSTMAQHPGAGPGKAGGLATGFGVTSSEITLGALTDYTGPFSELGLGAVQGHQIWISETNAAGGICGRKIKLKVRNHGYDTGKAKIQYLTVRDAKVASTDSDLRNVVTGFAGDPRVKAIALTTTPAQTASAAEVNQQLGLNVPMVGNNPVFAPQLLNGPAAGALGNLSVVASSVPFSSEVPQAQHVAQAFQQSGFVGRPNSGVPYGYAIGEICGQLLQRACNNGDITPPGILEAQRQIADITTDDLVADLDFAKPGAPAAREVYVCVPDAAVPGGIRQVKPLFVAPEARSYAAPHQSGD